MTTWLDMGNDFAAKVARDMFLRSSGLGRKSVRALHAHLLARDGLHRTEELGNHFVVSRATILRRLRILKRYSLITQVKGSGRADSGTVGGREQDMWRAVEGHSIDAVAGRFVEGATMGERLARRAVE